MNAITPFIALSIVFNDLKKKRLKYVCLFLVITSVIVLLASFKKDTYQSSITIFADNQNIIKPLLGRKAQVTEVKQSNIGHVREVIYSPRLMRTLVTQTVPGEQLLTRDLIEQKITEFRAKVFVEGLAGNYVKITFNDNSPEDAFSRINSLVSIFIDDSAKTKKKESRDAYRFIEQQVESYKEQLTTSENRLKEFHSTNTDGTAQEAETRIAQLRNTIESLKIEIEENAVQIASLENEIASESRFSANDYEASIYHAQLERLRQEKSALLMRYFEEHPDVLDINFRIEAIEKTIAELPEQESQVGANISPVYRELRSQLAKTQVEKRILENRLNSIERLYNEATQRRQRIAANEAQLSEYNRDYQVIKTQYEEMLAKKEKARLSMILDIEGQGVNYKIQEPAVFPNKPKGLRFIHLLIAAPILALMAIVGIKLIYAFIDQKIRHRALFNRGQLLSTIPNYRSHASFTGVLKVTATLVINIALCVALIGLAYLNQFNPAAINHGMSLITGGP